MQTTANLLRDLGNRIGGRGDQDLLFNAADQLDRATLTASPALQAETARGPLVEAIAAQLWADAFPKSRVDWRGCVREGEEYGAGSAAAEQVARWRAKAQTFADAIHALLTPADRGETQAVGDGWSTDMEAGRREPEVDLFLSCEGIRPHRRPLHYWDPEQRDGGAWTECADRNVTDPRDRIAIPSRWVTHWRKPPAPPIPSPDQNRGEPDQGGANTEAGR